MINFTQLVPLSEFMIQFQGGFAAKTICLETMTASGCSPKTLYTFYPEDSNKLQKFTLTTKDGEPSALTTDNLRFHFTESTDTFGRIIIYKLNMFKQT